MAEFEKLFKTVFYYPDAHSIAMATEGKERLRIDSQGQFGFGTKGKLDPKERIRIQGETSDATTLALNVTDSNKQSLLAVRNDGSVGIGIPAPATTNASNPNENASIGARAEPKERLRVQGETSDANKFAVKVTNSNKASLFAVRNDGNVGIGTAAPAARLHVPAGAILNGIAIGIDPPSDISFPFPYETVGTQHNAYNLRLHSGNVIHFHTGNSPAPVASIDLFGVYQTSSLAKKERINDLSGQEAIEILTNLKPVKFVFRGDREEKWRVGFIAEEVPAIAASADRTMISQMDIVGVLTKVVKEQQTTISELAERVHFLEAAYKDLTESGKSRQARTPKKTASVNKTSAKAMPVQPARRKPKRGATGPTGLPARRRKP